MYNTTVSGQVVKVMIDYTRRESIYLMALTSLGHSGYAKVFFGSLVVQDQAIIRTIEV